MKSSVNKELKQVKKWLDANKLALNVDKTNFVIFHSPKKSLDEAINIKIGKELMKQAKYVKFLGVLLDENLTWKHHLSELSKKLARTCGIFFKIRHLLPTNVFFLYITPYFPHFYNMGSLSGVLPMTSILNQYIFYKRKLSELLLFRILHPHLLQFFLT